MKLAYLSGPISASSQIEIHMNIMRAANIASFLRRKGKSVIVPHTSCMFHNDALTYDEWLEQDIRQLQACDEMFIMAGWGSSAGSCIEEKKAIELEIPIFGVIEVADNIEIMDYTLIKNIKPSLGVLADNMYNHIKAGYFK